MQKPLRFLIFLFLIIVTTVSAQKSEIYTNNLVDFNQAISLFNNKQYLSAQIIFEKVKLENLGQEVQSDCTFYSAICAIKLNHSNSDLLMQNFITDYPTSTKRNIAFIEIAGHNFDQGSFSESLKWFEKVDESSLNNDDVDKFNFQKGYAFFNEKNKSQATIYFNKVQNSNIYGSQAKYYLGFLAYEGDDFKNANKYFDQVAGDEKYKEKLSYFQADMSFKSGDFQKAIDLGSIASAKSNAQEKSELNKIIGESYFNLNQFENAIPFLNQYKGKKGKWNNTDYYQLGFAYYQQNDFENAITQFNKIIDGKDVVAQNAYYHLGQSYLKTNRKQQALNAFKNSSEMVFDLKIQEDAFLNYAKLSYDIGNSYQSVPDVLTSFLTKYPNSPSKIDVESLLINSFITSKNYKGALELLEKNRSFANKQAYQKVTFYRGLELFTDGNYQEALVMFKKSISEQQDPKFTCRATFWKGETEYVLDNFSHNSEISI